MYLQLHCGGLVGTGGKAGFERAVGLAFLLLGRDLIAFTSLAAQQMKGPPPYHTPDCCTQLATSADHQSLPALFSLPQGHGHASPAWLRHETPERSGEVKQTWLSQNASRLTPQQRQRVHERLYAYISEMAKRRGGRFPDAADTAAFNLFRVAASMSVVGADRVARALDPDPATLPTPARVSGFELTLQPPIFALASDEGSWSVCAYASGRRPGAGYASPSAEPMHRLVLVRRLPARVLVIANLGYGGTFESNRPHFFNLLSTIAGGRCDSV